LQHDDFLYSFIFTKTQISKVYIGYYTSELHFLPVKSENKKNGKDVDENQQLWYDKKKA